MDLEQGKLKLPASGVDSGSPERVSTAAAERREATVFVPGGGVQLPTRQRTALVARQPAAWARKQGKPQNKKGRRSTMMLCRV